METTSSNPIYSQCEITRTIILAITSVGKNIRGTIEKQIISLVEGKCILEGFVRRDSVKLVNYSSGTVKGTQIIYNTIFTCDVFYSVPGMPLNCVVKTVNAAGVQAESADISPSPFIVYIMKDHYYNNDEFNSIAVDDRIRVIAKLQRFEINDSHIELIADLDALDKERSGKPHPN
jgi:hypothetical protein